jgi:bacteriocin biosynthesis cyclodehydratase domain-containing protein
VVPADLMLVSFKGHLRVETVQAEAVCLISERGVTVLSGHSIEKLAPLLDGTRTVAQVKRELSSDLSADDVEALLGRLSAADLITYLSTRATERPGEGAHAYWNLAGLDGRVAAAALASSSVEVVAVGRTNRETADVAAAMCRASGLAVVEPGRGTAGITLALCDDYLDPALREINAAHIASARPWLLAKPSGAAPWIGPVFRPGAGPCWTCLAKRLEGNRLDGFLVRRGVPGADGEFPRPASLPASLAAALGITLLEAVKWLAGVRSPEQRGVYVLDTITSRGAHHPVARRPQCPSCGDPGMVAERARRPLTTVARPVTVADGNGHRVLSPAKVLELYGHLVDPVTGVVAELRRHPTCPDFLHSYQSGRNRAMTGGGIAAVRAGLRAQSGGKGSTADEAKAGALCEAIERYSATADGDEATVRDSYRRLGDQAVHPDSSQLFHPRQFADRTRWNAVCAPFHRVPEPFDERAVIDWTPVWSLHTQERKMLPTAMLYFTPNPGRAPVSVLADSNGNAAGGTLEDAILQGFLELVERDAVALWWYNRTRQPAVDLDSFDDPWVSGLRGRYAGLNRQVWVLDVTSDLGVPVMTAVSRRADKSAEDIMLGFGAHFDPRIALRRALTELGQLLPAVVGSRSDGSGYELSDPHLMSWWTRATVGNQPYLVPDPAQAPRTAAGYRYSPPRELDLSQMRAVTRRAGLDVLVLDQTRPDIGMPVVKVVVPGLRHFWPRAAPGRLYDVPVRLGRLAEPTAYEDLNPVPLYM